MNGAARGEGQDPSHAGGSRRRKKMPPSSGPHGTTNGMLGSRLEPGYFSRPTASVKRGNLSGVICHSESAHLAGGGELGALIRAFDWTDTPSGRPEAWPQSLKTAVRIMLTSRQPIWIGWGAELIYLYNDPYKSIIGGKHPWALGKPTAGGLARNLGRYRPACWRRRWAATKAPMSKSSS